MSSWPSRTEGFDDFKAKIAEYPPERVADDLRRADAEDIRKAARLMAAHKPGALMYAMGITQHTSGHGNVISCANLQMLLGNMGVSGGGVNPLRGQSNVQGACDMGGLLQLLQRLSERGARSQPQEVRGRLGRRAAGRQAGPDADRDDGCSRAGRVKAMYVIGENPALSDPDSNHVRHCLESLDFLVVQDLFLTETAQLADVILPGSSFAEKDGTFTNSERRVQHVQRAHQPGGREPARLGDHRRSGRPDAGAALAGAAQAAAKAVAEATHGSWDYMNPAEIMDEVADLTPSLWRHPPPPARRQRQRVCNGLAPTRSIPGTPILHVGKFTRGLGHLRRSTSCRRPSCPTRSIRCC